MRVSVYHVLPRQILVELAAKWYLYMVDARCERVYGHGHVGSRGGLLRKPPSWY